MQAGKAVILLLISCGLEFATWSLPIPSPPATQKQTGHAYINFVSLKEQDTFVSQLYSGADGHKVKEFLGCVRSNANTRSWSVAVITEKE